LVLKDPYVLDFLGLTDRFLERDLEDAILRELETFLLELGAGFSFVARQKRIQLDGDDFYIDLLFYNRKLKRLVVVELKQGSFKPEYKGQMELYLRWLAQHEREPDENMPLGIILCAGKNTEQIELLELGAPASMWPNISPCCRHPRYCGRSCIKLSQSHGRGSKHVPRREASTTIQLCPSFGEQTEVVLCDCRVFHSGRYHAPVSPPTRVGIFKNAVMATPRMQGMASDSRPI
jgi:RecB family endonuclease NucS